MIDVIRGAHDKRYKSPEEDEQKNSIVVSATWLDELQKHPYYSRENLKLINL